MQTLILNLPSEVAVHLEEIAQQSQRDVGTIVSELIEARHTELREGNLLVSGENSREAVMEFLRWAEALPAREGESYQWRREDAYDHPTRH